MLRLATKFILEAVMVEKRVKIIIFVLLISLTLVGGVLAAVQSYDLGWWTVDGGGGTTSGGNYQLKGTIGQPDPVVMAGGNFSLQGGFWGISGSGFGYRLYLPVTIR